LCLEYEDFELEAAEKTEEIESGMGSVLLFRNGLVGTDFANMFLQIWIWICLFKILNLQICSVMG
jgi:hypothetical protein